MTIQDYSYTNPILPTPYLIVSNLKHHFLSILKKHKMVLVEANSCQRFLWPERHYGDD